MQGGLGQLFWLDLINKYLIVSIIRNWFAYTGMSENVSV